MIFKHALAAISSLALGLTATPALADESATATQITGVIKADSEGAPGNIEFTELFASWTSPHDEEAAVADKPFTVAPAPRPRVSVPSRMPVDGVRLSSSYGMRTHPVLGGRRAHNGVDLAQAAGTPVYATADGRVARADYWGSYGNYIQIEHGGELQTRYAHLSGFEVVAGEQVVKGQLIGYIGSTGRSTGPHLHYEVRVAGQPVDPRPYMFADLTVSEDATAMGGPDE